MHQTFRPIMHEYMHTICETYFPYILIGMFQMLVLNINVYIFQMTKTSI